jgi:flagellar hook-associated protein 2
MGRIQSNVGLSSGFDIKSTVDQLIAISAQPKLRLEARLKEYQSQQIAIGELTALVLGVQSQVDRLGKASNLSSLSATSSDDEVIKTRSTGSPVTGNYLIHSLQTAQTQAASSNAYTSVDDTVQAGEFVVRTGGFVDGSADLDDLRGGAGISRGKIQITDRSGTAREVDLSRAITIEDVVKSINPANGLKVNAKVGGDRIEITDLTGLTTSNLIVTEVGEGRTAADLGLNGINVAANSASGDDLAFLTNATRLSTIRDGRGLGLTSGNDLSVTLKDGTSLTIDLNTTNAPSTVGQLLSRINAANPAKFEARLSADGDGLEFLDKTTGSGSFNLSGNAADQLGLTGRDGSTGTIATQRLQSTLQGPLIDSLNGGRGIGSPGLIEITNRQGATTSVDLTGSIGLRDVIDRINQANAGVTASFNQSRTGISLRDTTGATTANLRITDGDSSNAATKLGIAGDVAANSLEGGNLGLQYISQATELSKLNQGRGVRLGSFTITDSNGQSSTLNLNSTKPKTLGDVLKAINDSSVGVEARLNETGDGIVLIDTAGGTGELSVDDATNGNAALDLGIRGKGKTVTVESVTRLQIEGSQTFRLTLDGDEKLSEVVKTINDANGPLTASTLSSGPSTVRLLFSSRSSGNIGRFVIEGGATGLEASTTTQARDAIISVGSSLDSGGTLVRSSSNTFDDTIDGLQLTVAGTSSSAIEVSVTRSNSSIEKTLQALIDQFNRIVEKVKKETSFDAASNTTGILFGSGDVLRVEQSLTNLVYGKSYGFGKINSLVQLGVKIDSNGRASLDKARLNDVLTSDGTAVEQFLTDEKNGFSVRSSKALENLVAVKTGSLLVRNESLQRRIEDGGRRVDFYNVRLTAERIRLEKQFYGMEEAIAKIRSNTSAINGIQNLFATTV